jgi:hypothetical protein
VVEVLQRMGAGSAGLSCPACGQGELEKELSTFASGAPAAGAAAAGPGAAGCAPRGGFS